MTLTALAEASPLILFHAATAMVSLVLGPVVIHRRRRDRLHKVSGYIWVTAMMSVAISALFIPSFGLAFVGHFGPIHLFAVLVFHGLWQGMRAIYKGNIRQHQQAFRGLYYRGLAIAGLVNFLPDRMINRMFFPDAPQLGYAVIAIGLVLLFWPGRGPGTRLASLA